MSVSSVVLWLYKSVGALTYFTADVDSSQFFLCPGCSVYRAFTRSLHINSRTLSGIRR
jgi:hypothetical protein